MTEIVWESGKRHEEAPGVLSPSQIETWNDCHRKWAFNYIEHIRPPTQGSAALGSDTHAQLENYLTGKQLDFTRPSGDIASLGLEHLPLPKTPGMEIERSFRFASAKTGIHYRGFVDMCISPEFRSEYVPLIHDHKTTSNIKVWAKTPEILQTDAQAIIYSKSALLRWPSARDIDLQWLYMQTKGAKTSKLVQLRLSRDHVEKKFDDIEVVGREIVATLHRKPRALELEPNPETCDKYGGCPFRSQCNLSPQQHLFALMSSAKEKNMSNAPLSSIDFLGSLKTTPATPLVVTDQDVPEGKVETSPFFANLPPVTSPFPPTDQPINPPEYQSPPPSGHAAVEAAAAAAAKAEPTKGKRGRPRKASAEVRTEALPFDTIPVPGIDAANEDCQAGGPGLSESQVETLYRHREMPFTLYLDCLPVGEGSYIFAETYIAQANEELKAGLSVPEWRLGEPMGFGRGAGFLSSRVAEIAKDKNKNVVLDTRTPEGAACKVALMALTNRIVMGFR